MYRIDCLIRNRERLLGLGCRSRAMGAMDSVFGSLPDKHGYSNSFVFSSYRIFIISIIWLTICASCYKHNDTSDSGDASNYLDPQAASNHPYIQDAGTLREDSSDACVNLDVQIGKPCTGNLKCFEGHGDCLYPYCGEGCTFIGYSREPNDFTGYINTYTVCDDGVWVDDSVGSCPREEDVICECQDTEDDADSGSQ